MTISTPVDGTGGIWRKLLRNKATENESTEFRGGTSALRNGNLQALDTDRAAVWISVWRGPSGNN